MQTNEQLRISFNNVDFGFDMLVDEFRDLQKAIKNFLHELIERDDFTELQAFIEVQQKVNEQINAIIGIKKDWNTYLHSKVFMSDFDGGEIVEEEEDDEESISAVDRTSWRVVDDVVRIETVRPNNGVPYTNNIPVGLFRDIVLTCIDQFERYEKTFLKTSNINALMKEKIIKESGYKKATKSAIYSVFKVLLKESILSPFENMKRAYTLSKSADEIREWLDSSFKQRSN